MMFKLQENRLKQECTAYENAIKELTHEDKVIQKNLKMLLNSCEIVESLEFAVRNKDNALEIFGVIEQSIEKDKANRKYAQNKFDWSGTLIVLAMRNRFLRNKNPHTDFQHFIAIILGGYEKDIDHQTAQRNIYLANLIKQKNRLDQRLKLFQQDFGALDLLLKTMRRSQFIKNAAFSFYLYRFE
jgi:hypothetical protein